MNFSNPYMYNANVLIICIHKIAKNKIDFVIIISSMDLMLFSSVGSIVPNHNAFMWKYPFNIVYTASEYFYNTNSCIHFVVC